MQPVDFQPQRGAYSRRFLTPVALCALWIFFALLMGNSAHQSDMEKFLWVAPAYGIICLSPFIGARFPIFPADANDATPVIQYAVRMAKQIGASLVRVTFEDSQEISISRGVLNIPGKLMSDDDSAKLEAGIALALLTNRRDWASRLLSIAILLGSFVASLLRTLTSISTLPNAILLSVIACLPIFFIPLLVSSRMKPRLVLEAIALTDDPGAMERYLASADPGAWEKVGRIASS